MLSTQLGYEIRSTTVHEQMMQMWKSNFNVKTVSKSKMDVKYQHPSIHLYIMDPKATLIPEVSDNGNNEEEEVVSNPGDDEDPGAESGGPCTGSVDSAEAKTAGYLDDDWEIRRCGAMAARLLKDVKLA